jgi:hypothetical protein
MQNRQFIHRYEGFGGAPSSCRLTFSKTVTGLSLCIADELPHNSGTPIREFAEHLATHAYRELFAPNGTHIEEFLYIEHAPQGDASREYSYALVDFDWDDEGMQFIHPRRTLMSDEEVAALTGQEQNEEANDNAEQ